MDLGASLTWNNFWMESFFIKGIHGLKDAIKFYILTENETNSLSRFRENSEKPHFWPLFHNFKKI